MLLRLISSLVTAIALLAFAACGGAIAQQNPPIPPENVGPPAPAEDKGAEPPPVSNPTAPSTAPEVKHVAPAVLPPLPDPNDPKVAARELFARKLVPAHLPPRVIGGYADGCLAGAAALPIDGPTWQVMRLSRNRNWGHPNLIRFLERYAPKAAQAAHWPGILIGDLSQPRGGPALSGHASHQVGLDVDVWLTPMQESKFSREERETFWAKNFVAGDGKDVDRKLWTPGQAAIIRQAALDPDVERIFINAAIKKELCRAAGSDRGWLHKVRPWYRHQDHLHIRLRCPAGNGECKPQPAPPSEEGCGKDLDFWFTEAVLHPKPPSGPVRQLTMANLPAECRKVLNAP
jgi:penicillin-insensitive murein DD-endopeptidase